MLVLVVHLHVATVLAASRAGAAVSRLRSERGQTSAEYALVLLGAASIALLLVAWAKKGNRIGGLLDSVFDDLVAKVR